MWGWSHVYDPAKLHELSLAFGPAEPAISPAYTFQNPPLLAWIIAPLTLLSLPAALYTWTAINIAAIVAAWRLASPGTGFARATVWVVSVAFCATVLSLERHNALLMC